ncbi:hypothetical protein [Streptomyces yaizuensis]|uniref:CDP-glycerol glycerophosphotransferase family protein n=1 Tax=Streptomyces yaizuensis TaxID=2989713 RepID=A0ABQ5NTP4_9ACTN|nr:hypothetical protein [Streptomyces sp. YSPA8]GLF93738.1 CDP-glycerol glycerophosphotransferase family protein [Streptomyces sp. YSPA8]
MISTAIRLARVGSLSELTAAALIGLGYPCVMIAALLPNVWLFAAFATVTYAADWYLHRKGSYLINRLAKVRVGLTIRFLLRQVLLVLLLAREGLAESPLFYTAVAGFLVFYALQAPHGALTTLIRLRRAMPVVTRNVDLQLDIPDAAPLFLRRRAAEKMLHLDIPAMLGVLLAAALGENVLGYAGIGLSVAFGLLYIAALAPYLRRGKRVPAAPVVLEAVSEWLRQYQPTVVLYFSGSSESAYQGNMWLETMENIEGRPLIIMRERGLVGKLHPTTVPVICVPGATHLMNMDLSSVRVALYPANVGKNIHLLRVPTIQHVFIGHGDSDKLASVNPYSKVYDEVWTAGRAGRDRYALADVGVRDDDIVEVGRPQLAPIKPWTGTPKNPIPTVLYAPTWEGWDTNPGNTSILLAGENIVRRLLAAENPVRVIFKPHPFTGIRDKQAKIVSATITTMIREANAARAADPSWAAQAVAAKQDQETARAAMVRIEAELAELAITGKSGRDGAELSRDSLADPQRLARIKDLRAEWNEAYWGSAGWWEHLVVTGPEPKIYDCFNESDAMVSDISSVVSDFMASGKPYALTDSAELGAEEFQRQNTAARAAVILTNSAAELDELLAAVASPERDTLAQDRQELKEYLLGPDNPPSMDRFNDAVRALAAESESRNLGVEERLNEQAQAQAEPGIGSSSLGSGVPADAGAGAGDAQAPLSR